MPNKAPCHNDVSIDQPSTTPRRSIGEHSSYQKRNTLVRPTRMWEKGVKINVGEISYEVDWILLAQNRVQ
jgi:hypothetical protein